MRRFSCILGLLLALTASAQIRTYGDMESKTFVIGLDSYYYGTSGSLSFTAAGIPFQAELSGGTLTVVRDGARTVLVSGQGEALSGIHDFTGDGQPELLAAYRRSGIVLAYIYEFRHGAWTLIGKVGATGDGVSEIRVFRQALTIKDKDSGTLHTWTCHGGRFDFKSSAGCPDPTP